MNISLHKKLSIVKDFATKSVIKQFANKYHLVYFGHVDYREDEYEMVRGVTSSTSHTDNHYSVGSHNGHDILLLERRNTLTFPGKPDTVYKWTIMQFDLSRSGLPHIFIDSHHHDVTFYGNLFIRETQFQDANALFLHSDPQFAAQCRVFAASDQFAQVGQVLTHEITSTISQHFKQFDFEIDDDRLFVYASNAVVTPQTLEDMLRIGTWLTEKFNAALVSE